VVRRPNVLLLTLDQFRGDHLGCVGHPLVRTPNLDALAADGVLFTRHYSQAAPCAPGRACLYTGTYQANNRVVANGTPLDRRFDNLALMARRAGYAPALFGYTDQAVDPADATGPDDRWLRDWEGLLPGFDWELELTEAHAPWMRWLAELGYDVDDPIRALATEHHRPAEHSVTTFTTDRVLQWLDRRDDQPWFAHLSYLRPHPPYSAPGDHAAAYPLEAMLPAAPPVDDDHPLLAAMRSNRELSAPADPAKVARIRSHYLGMITQLDEQLGRVWAALRESGEWDRTVVVVTADHGEQLGDQGLIQKAGWFDASYHVLGIVRDPARPHAHGTVVDVFTENVDVFPTLCELVGEPIPRQCDGRSLTPWLDGESPESWRTAAVHEWDWRDQLLQFGARDGWPARRGLARQHLTVRRTTDHAYVQFGDGDWRCYDLAADPHYGARITDPAVVLPHAQALLTWRQEVSERTHTSTLITADGPLIP
jgi:arylsulfatase A-like enzyme